MGHMLNKTLIAVLTLTAFAVSAPLASAAPNRPASPPPTDFWKDQGFMLFAHQGGERENPGNTLFAFKKAISDGADVIDMDLTLTKDNQLIATHDSEPCHTSDGPCTPFRELNLEQVRGYDFGYWFSPGLATYYDKSLDVPHPYRGMATGDVTPPSGYTANDFRIATFSEILDAFPNTPMNVELKPYADTQATAEAAAAALAAHPGRESDVIVNAFKQEMIEAFHTAAPNHLALGGSLDKTLAYVQGNAITPTPVAVQPPDKYDLGGGNVVDTLPLLSPHFEYDGYISVVWPSDLDETQETDPWYAKLISQGAGAINTMFPSRLQTYLCDNNIPRPDGTPRCPEQTTVLTKVMVGPKSGTIKAGKTLRLKVSVRANVKFGPNEFVVRLKSSNRQVKLPGSVKVKLNGKEGSRVIVLRATKKAKGKAAVTASNGKLKASSVFRVKPVCAKKSASKGGGLCGKTNHL